MKYDFDEIVDRKNTNSVKYDFAAEMGKPEGLIPLWVADMDFKTPLPVTEALVKTAEHSIFGYTNVKSDYFHAVNNWFSTRFAFDTRPEWLVKTPGVVNAMCMAIRAFTGVSDSVLIQPPVYYPFMSTVVVNDRKAVTNPLAYRNGRYYVDLEDFEKKIVKNDVKLFILCNPHNPVGRVWTKEELTDMGSICLKHNVLVVSDEIHCDFIYKGHKHTVFASINGDFLENSVICTAPSKTFNLAGLQISNIFIADEAKRKRFAKEIGKTGLGSLNAMGLAACQAAYTHGSGWVDALNGYLAENLNYIREFISRELPMVRLVEPEGTYLVWLNFSALSLSEEELDHLMIHKAGLWVHNGSRFGKEGNGFVRINIACPAGIIKQAFNQLKAALE